MKAHFRYSGFFPREFFCRTPLRCARELTGAIFQWKAHEVRVVETEAYDSVGDPACHTWTRPSARHFVETHAPGSAYVYLNYGMHWLFNVLIKGSHRSGFVLIRAVEVIPREGLEIADRKAGAGPGKAARLLGIDGSVHGLDLCDPKNATGFRRDEVRLPAVLRSPRVGISQGQDLFWRFYLKNHPSVSGPRFPLARNAKS